MQVAHRCGKSRMAYAAAGLLLPLALVTSALAQELPFTHYTTESSRNPLPSAAVTGVHQDALGFIWFSVFSTGLVRYDGGVMEVYDGDDGIRDLGVYRLVEDARGRLWVASQGGVVASDRPLGEFSVGERVRFASRLHGVDLPSGPINTNGIAADRGGSVWVGVLGAGLLRFRVGALETVVDTVLLDDGSSPGEVTALLMRDDGTLLVGSYDGSLLRMTSTGQTLRRLPIRLSQEDYITVLSETSEGQLWAGTQRGELLRLDESGDEPRLAPTVDAMGSMITSIVEGADGSLWIGSEGSGVQRFDPERGDGTLYGESHGLLSETVHEIMRDAEGNLWFAQLGGASKLRGNFDAFRNYTARSHRGERPTLPSASVGTIAIDEEGETPCRIWAGTAEGGIACIRGDGSSVYLQSEDGLRSDLVNALALDESGHLWIGSQSGIQRLSFDAPAPTDQGARRILVDGKPAWLVGYGPDQISIFTISRVSIPGAGSESLCLAGFDLFCRVDGRWFILGSPSGLPQVRLHAVAADDEGRLWVSTQGEGLYRSREPVDLSTLRQAELTEIELDAPEGGRMKASVVTLPLFEQVSLGRSDRKIEEAYRLVWIDGSLWAATSQGVVVLGPSAESADSVVVVARLGQADGLGADLAMSMAHAPATGSVWVGTNGGLSEIDLDRRAVVRTLTTQDGLVGNEGWYTGSVAVAKDGTVYYGSARGLTAYRPALDVPNHTLPRIRLRAVSFTMRGGNNEFTARYAALGFAEESEVRYRTRLGGYDTEWSSARTDDRIRYTNLPAFLLPKTYTLEILASNSSGLWAEEPLRYRFDVPPPPWLRWWAMGIYGLVLVGGAAGVHRAQQVRLLRRERERARIKEAELRAETAQARSEMAEAVSRSLQEENRLKEAELEKARELEQAYHTLKLTQAQLIQSEKLASLGQLTAGIAHEIKNPLNFVTNFAALTREVASELVERSDAEPDLRLTDVREDLDIIKLNAQKIDEHGRRADGIVRSMLEHSRGGPGERQPTDVNGLLEQYVNLAYHGEKARKPGFDVRLDRAYAADAGSVVLVQQELGRVLLNLLDNAFYAVHERSLSTNGAYQPTVTISTRAHREAVEIAIEDNGVGMTEDVRQKIFEPFFTTKPTGQGTGLGLSLSHNIVVQGCGGEFLVESEEGKGTRFVVRLPRSG